jgi:hypothetical protein
VINSCPLFSNRKISLLTFSIEADRSLKEPKRREFAEALNHIFQKKHSEVIIKQSEEVL